MLKMRDIRIPEVKHLLQGMLGKADLKSAEIMVTGDFVLANVLNTAIYSIKLSTSVNDFDNILCFRYEESMELEEDEIVQNPLLFKKLERYYLEYILSIPQYPLLCFDNDLRNDPNYEQLLKLKSADGMKFYQMHGKSFSDCYFIPVFSGFPKVNKSDKIGIHVYRLLDGNHFLIQYTINKVKLKKEFQITFRILDLMKEE